MQPSRIWIVAGVVLLLVGATPLLAMAAASLVAHLNGCALGEGEHPCCVLGWDLGRILYVIDGLGPVLAVTMWLVPAGIAFFFLGLFKRSSVLRPTR